MPDLLWGFNTGTYIVATIKIILGGVDHSERHKSRHPFLNTSYLAWPCHLACNLLIYNFFSIHQIIISTISFPPKLKLFHYDIFSFNSVLMAIRYRACSITMATSMPWVDFDYGPHVLAVHWHQYWQIIPAMNTSINWPRSVSDLYEGHYCTFPLATILSRIFRKVVAPRQLWQWCV